MHCWCNCINIGLNLLFIPIFGIIGAAAAATLISEVIWLTSAIVVSACVGVVPLRAGLMQLLRPMSAGGAMSICFFVAADLPWSAQLAIAGTVFLAVLVLSGDKELRSWVPKPSALS